jgi:SAM-dependent methyltransferase
MPTVRNRTIRTAACHALWVTTTSKESPMSITEQSPAIDEQAVEAFVERVVTDLAAATTTTLASIGDRVGLWRALASGPATSAELATQTRTVERYVREWCAAMTCAGYLSYDGDAKRFTLPTEHALVLADDSTRASLGGQVQLTRGMVAAADDVEAAFREGGGVEIARYGEHFWAGLDRATGVFFDHALVQDWVPAIDGLEARLREGALVADIGCGSGRAVVRLAEAFPASTFHGYDVADEAVERARRAAQEAGVADRVEFRHLDATEGLPERYDLICTFDVVHDSRDPQGLLSGIRGSLRPDGVYLCLDITAAEHLEDDGGPISALKYGYSVLHCMTTSLARDGAGFGTCGLPPSRVRALVDEAGFGSLRIISETPLESVYEIRP